MTFQTHKHCCRGQYYDALIFCVLQFCYRSGWPPAVVLKYTRYAFFNLHEAWNRSKIIFGANANNSQKKEKVKYSQRKRLYAYIQFVCTTLMPQQPYLQLSPDVSANQYWAPLLWALFHFAGQSEGFAKTVWPALMNSDLIKTLHLGTLTTELSVGNAQSCTLRLKTTVSFQQQHLQRFSRVLTKTIQQSKS